MKKSSNSYSCSYTRSIFQFFFKSSPINKSPTLFMYIKTMSNSHLPNPHFLKNTLYLTLYFFVLVFVWGPYLIPSFQSIVKISPSLTCDMTFKLLADAFKAAMASPLYPRVLSPISRDFRLLHLLVQC